ncbi:hypothetical protein DMUE_1745 [Dictyocoela muelleri]|nr:hypothetical protein DMUE_1745 [Dictyocoela muelleri]
MAEETYNSSNFSRKSKNYITKETIKIFLKLIKQEKTQKKIMNLMELSRSSIQRLQIRYINGDFCNDQNIISSEDNKRGSKKDTTDIKIAINLELTLNPCTTLKYLSMNISNNRDIMKSAPRICLQIKQ